MDILKRISDCVVNMDESNIERLIRQAIDMGNVSPHDVYSDGLHDGMVRAIQLYDDKKYDIPELIVCADTLNKGVALLISYGNLESESKGKIVLAVVEGDTHEIGKNIVKIMLEAAGYEIVDLGVNRSAEEIIGTAIEHDAHIIGLSSMMTTTRGEMKTLIEKVDSMNLSRRPYIIVGGGSITESYSTSIKADGYASNAPNAIKMVQRLLREGK